MKNKLYISVLLVLTMFIMLAAVSAAQAITFDSSAVILPAVTHAVDYVEITPTSNTVEVGSTASYQAIVHWANGGTADVTSECSWGIQDDIATSTTPGSFQGTTAGSTKVWAYYSKIQASTPQADLIVTAAQEKDQLVLIILPSTATIYTGDSQQYRAYLHHTVTVTPDQDVTDVCTWSIDNTCGTATATKGLYDGAAVGSATVTAHYVRTSSQITTAYFPPVDLYATAGLVVINNPKKGRLYLDVTPDTASIMVGESQQYKAILKNTNGDPDTDVTSLSTWSLSTSIATPLNKGLYKGTAKGTAVVRAEYESVSGLLSDTAKLIVDELQIPPPTEKLPDGKMIDRQPGYITLSTPQNLGTPGTEFLLDYDQSKMDGNPDRHPKVFYWNASYQKWVALASYPQSAGKIKAMNDGGYSGWFVVMGCIQPNFKYTAGVQWAEQTANRMNGLGLLEGYPNPANPGSLTRPAGLERIITRAELTTAVARILGLAPGDTHLYPTISALSPAETNQVLSAHYTDAGQIPAWARTPIASMTKAGLVNGKGSRFAPQDKLTRIEAAVIISNALKNVPSFGTPADLSSYSDASQVPAWAVGHVAQGTIHGYPDGTLRPNRPTSRAESISLLLTLLKGLGW